MHISRVVKNVGVKKGVSAGIGIGMTSFFHIVFYMQLAFGLVLISYNIRMPQVGGSIQ